jgi:hypothetical protein
MLPVPFCEADRCLQGSFFIQSRSRQKNEPAKKLCIEILQSFYVFIFFLLAVSAPSQDFFNAML